MGICGPTPPWRSMFCRMLEKNAVGPGACEVFGARIKRGDSLHSRARRVVASTAADLSARVDVGENFGREGEDLGDLMFANGVESIKSGTSRRDAKPPAPPPNWN